jgi:putative oxidoreductase
MKGCREILIHLFRTFPAGRVGVGLLLLRVITALALGYCGYSLADESAGGSALSLPRVIGVLMPIVGILMIAGFGTAVAGTLACALALVSLGLLHLRSNGFPGTAAGLSLVLVLVGPGAYSLDARFFGWRRVEITRHTPRPKPKGPI